MGGIFSALEISSQAMRVNQTALQVTSHNIANVNTPGYSRQQAQLEDMYFPQNGLGELGYGVRISGITSYRDRFVELRLMQESQNKGALYVRTSGLDQIQSLLAPSTGGLLEGIQDFFSSFQALASDPTDTALRTDIISQGNRLANMFHQANTQILSLQTSMDDAVGSLVSEVNQITGKIAQLNQNLVEAGATPNANVSDIRDQRDQYIKQLAERIGITTYEDNFGRVTVQTEGGGLLVTGNTHQTITTGPSAGSPFQHLYINGNDITATVHGGQLGGVIQVRDVDIPYYKKVLDDLAGTMINQVNLIHQAGFDLNGNTTINFFQPYVSPVPGTNQGAANAIAVAVTDPAAIAASNSATAPGDNTNAKALAALQDTAQAGLGGMSMLSFWNAAITKIGVDTQSSTTDQDANKAVMSQLQNMRDSASGVSLDEEGTDLIRYQRAYEAMGRFFASMNTLTAELMQLLGG